MSVKKYLQNVAGKLGIDLSSKDESKKKSLKLLLRKLSERSKEIKKEIKKETKKEKQKDLNEELEIITIQRKKGVKILKELKKNK